MCDKTKPVRVKIASDLSHTGKAYWKDVEIDSCIADLVSALQEGGIDMRASCCGHGKTKGSILLQDGRKLMIIWVGGYSCQLLHIVSASGLAAVDAGR